VLAECAARVTIVVRIGVMATRNTMYTGIGYLSVVAT
jgi:hypothetical protein